MVVWTLDQLNHEWSVLLRLSIEGSIAITYSSTTNSCLMFCKIHQLLIDPTPDTLTPYNTFQSHFISPSLVESYLSGICHQLEPFYLDMWKHQGSVLVKWTLRGVWCSRNIAVEWKVLLMVHDLSHVHDWLVGMSHLDVPLFDTQLNSGFCRLLQLGELVSTDKKKLRDWQKVKMHHTLEWLLLAYAFWLPWHKSDTTFKGNHIMCRQIRGASDPVPIMHQYVKLCDQLFPLHLQLWLQGDGSMPVQS